MTDEALAPLISTAKIENVPKGEFYIRAGDTTDRLGFVTSGLLRFYYVGEDGRDYTSWFASEASFVPSYAMVATRGVSRFYVEALEAATVINFPFSVFEMLEETSEAARFITKQFLLRALKMKEEREASLILDDAQTRYEAFRRDSASIEHRLKLHHIASYLDISPVSLSRIRRKINLG